MIISTVFTDGHEQAVWIPADARFPERVKQVRVRALGKERIITPVENTWDSFFTSGLQASDDFFA